MAIARSPSFVLDCDDPGRLAAFYGAMLGWTAGGDEGWAEIRDESGGQGICFQRVEHYRAPDWPGQDVPQQVHLDVMVDDLDTAGEAVLALGATLAGHQPGTRSGCSSTRPVTPSASACRDPARRRVPDVTHLMSAADVRG